MVLQYHQLITAAVVLVAAMLAVGGAPLYMRAMDQLRVGKISSLLRPVLGGTVLDVGCYDGHLSSRLLKDQQQQPPPQDGYTISSINGIDPYLPDQVAIPAEWYDGVTIPAQDKQYDVAMANFILHHAGRNGTVALCREMKRVSRRVVVFEDNVETSMAWGTAVGLHEIMRVVVNMEYDRNGFHTKAEWKHIFEDECGLRVVAVRDYSSSMLFFPFLRHTLYILEDNDQDGSIDNNARDHLLPPVELMHQSGWSDLIVMVHTACAAAVVLAIVVSFKSPPSSK